MVPTRKTGFVVLFTLALLGGCETDDPCARRQAACVDVVLVGKRDDGAGGPIAYRGLTVSVFAPNLNGTGAASQSTCDRDMTTAKPHLYGNELGPVGTSLAASEVPELVLTTPYLATIQGKLTFQLPDSFNSETDRETEYSALLDQQPDDASRIAEMKKLRDSDPRALRILVTQAGETHSVWDSRCDEEQFSGDEWKQKRWYRAGKNKYVSVMALLEGAKTSAP